MKKSDKDFLRFDDNLIYRSRTALIALRSWSIVIVAAVCVATAGCTTHASKDYRLDAQSDDGLIIVSVTTPATDAPETIPTVAFHFHPQGQWRNNFNTRSITLTAKPWADANTAGKPQVFGQAFALVVPAGTYDFGRFTLFKWGSSFQSTNVPSLPVTVQAGEAVYIGNIHTTLTYRTELLGVIWPDNVTITVNDRYERDLSTIKDNHPNLDTGSVRKAVLRNGWLGHRYIMR